MRSLSRKLPLLIVLLAAALPALPAAAATSTWTLVGWNNLGMHCMDSDYSVFSILPPYNTIHAQLIDPAGNRLRDPAGITVTYEAVADTDGSINTTSRGKTGFWRYVSALFGAAPAEDVGLTGLTMPGASNQPQPMSWDAGMGWFIAEGIPITPYDDRGRKNPYPMMQLVARDRSGAVLAVTRIVLPVSDEMDCSACHASGSAPAARPAAGWVSNPNRDLDYRLNILRLHDDRQGTSTAYRDALATAGYDAGGLYRTATGGKPILCARCHASNALPGTGLPGIAPLTRSVHDLHGRVVDPTSGLTLGSTLNRSACYRCHPGSTTRCLRGAMGSSVAADGSMAIQCQGCHGSMSMVGDAGRQGWLEEPDCQSCHTGTAVRNRGELRYTSAFEASGQTRQPADPTFATQADTPAAGLSLYRFSRGHGGLACEACHGSTHAEYRSSHANDNVQSRLIQGHEGVLVECDACHGSMPRTANGGPHGMHPVGPSWVGAHGDVAEDGHAGPCQACHGTDYRGTVLSRSQADWTFATEFGTKVFWRGFRVGCFNCHDGPGSERAAANQPARVTDTSLATAAGAPATVTLPASDPEGNALTLRIVSQPDHGTAGLSGRDATYFPEPGFAGSDIFTFAAWDGTTDSNLGTVRVTVTGSACVLASCSAGAPISAQEGQAVAFTAAAQTQGCASAPAFAWTFGDGQSANQPNPVHAYGRSGSFTWTMTASVAGQSCSRSGVIAIGGQPPQVTLVTVLNNPFRVVLRGSNFHAGMQVLVNRVAWPNVVRQGSGKITLRSGAPLQALFPPNTFVPITLINRDDGMSVTVELNRTTNQWRAAP